MHTTAYTFQPLLEQDASTISWSTVHCHFICSTLSRSLPKFYQHYTSYLGCAKGIYLPLNAAWLHSLCMCNVKQILSLLSVLPLYSLALLIAFACSPFCLKFCLLF